MNSVEYYSRAPIIGADVVKPKAIFASLGCDVRNLGWSNYSRAPIIAARVKPKARLCEPWVALKTIVRSRGAATASVVTEGRAIRLVRQTFASKYLGRRSAAPNKFYYNVNPRLAKPRLGLNSDRCFAAPSL